MLSFFEYILLRLFVLFCDFKYLYFKVNVDINMNYIFIFILLSFIKCIFNNSFFYCDNKRKRLFLMV